MGWWDTGIMGGDTPWDVAGLVSEALGLYDKEDDDDFGLMHMPEDWDDDNRTLVREAFGQVGVGEVAEELLAAYDGDLDGQCVALEVLGLLVMSCGAGLPDEVRKMVLDACDADDWAAEDDERKAHIDAFRKLVVAYKGEPVRVEQDSLWDKLDRAFSDS
jgi:hypothetical protein